MRTDPLGFRPGSDTIWKNRRSQKKDVSRVPSGPQKSGKNQQFGRLAKSSMAKGKQKKPDKNAGKASAAETSLKHIAENRKSSFRFEILEQIECGIVLLGSEVKSLRQNQISLDEAYVRVRDRELWLVGADIAEYKQATIWNHAPRRPRKLLVNKKQLGKLAVRTMEKGLTLVPLRLYFNPRGIIKVVVGVCRGKKMHDKRESLKKADAKRSIDRAIRRK